MSKSEATIADLLKLRPADEWHEDYGDVLWHHIGEWGNICEAPIVSCGGEELDGKQPWEGYYSYWSRLPPMPNWPLRSLMIAPPGMLICDWEEANNDR